jgi:hypothetical protein
MNQQFRKLILSVMTSIVVVACSQNKTVETAATNTGSTFATPDEAVNALAAAAEKNDTEALRQLFGPVSHDLLKSGDDVADRNALKAFVERFHKRHQLVAGGSDSLALQVGEDDWPLPIPLVKQHGRWHFDGAAGAEAIVRRRIGANELRTIDVMHGYVAAQKEYAAAGHDGAPAGVYAQRLRSDPGKHNGLYWDVASGEKPSPAGPFLAAAGAEGYGVTQGTPYHGYLYKPLSAQGPDAAGGSRDYIVDGKLTKGFALIAYPADYGASGIMSFIVNQEGMVWQRDMGENTGTEATALQQFNPDSKWTPIPPES